jgi:tetratricopeptide (TPR) repeat protein
MKFRRLACILLILITGCGVNSAERNNTGNDLYQQGNYRAAIYAYQAAEVLAPEQPEPYYNAGMALAQSGDIEKATAALKQALRTADDNLATQAYYNLGNVYFGTSHYEEAIAAYQQTLIRRPDDSDARYNLELALKRLSPPSATPGTQAEGTEDNLTPTAESSGQQVSTPTPESGTLVVNPTQFPQAGASATAGITTPQNEPTMSVEEAEQRLDAVQEKQLSLSQYLQLSATPNDPTPEKDW